MSELEKLHENIIKTAKLESNIDHLSNRVERLCVQLDNSLPLLEKINIRLEDDITRRNSSDKILTKVVDDVNQISFLSETHTKKLSEHEKKISDLTKIKWIWKGIVSFGVAAISALGYIENKKDERRHEAIIVMHEIEEKKKRIDYNREKYLIRNGKWKDEKNI